MYSGKPGAFDLDGKGSRKVSVMLVDDDPVFRQMVVAMLQTHRGDQLDVVGTASSSEECILQAQALAPEVVVMDLDMPGRGGLWAIPLLQILFPETHVIALAHSDGKDSRRAVLAAGGTALVSKAAWQAELIPTIKRALEMGDQHPKMASA